MKDESDLKMIINTSIRHVDVITFKVVIPKLGAIKLY